MYDAVVFAESAEVPIAILSLPFVFFWSALFPNALFLAPKLLKASAESPNVVFAKLFAPGPRPTVMPETFKSK